MKLRLINLIIIVFLIISVVVLSSCCSRLKEPLMPMISLTTLPNSFSNATDILVLPLWQEIPYIYTDTQERLYILSLPFIASDLQFITSSIDRHVSWNVVTPGFRMGNKSSWLRGIYLFLKTGEIVWLTADVGYETRWGYIKWATMCKEWQNEIETAIEKKKILRRKEADYKFFGSNYGDYMKIEVKLTPDEKKMVKDYLDSIDYGKITNGGQWKLMFE